MTPPVTLAAPKAKSSAPIFAHLERSIFDEANPTPYLTEAVKGLSEDLIQRISADKGEPAWMLEHRLNSLRIFHEKLVPTWGADLSKLDLDDIIYYARPGVEETDNWEEVPEDIRRVYERLGIPEAERRVLAGVGAQYESEVIYHRLKQEWEEQGVIFLDMDDALRLYPELVRQYFMKCVPSNDHKFAALHGAVWSGGTFLYVPRGVKVRDPLQAYFRMNARNMGQFEHTLIIVEEEADVSYIEGCFTAGTRITTNPDYKPIEEVSVGDRVLTHKGNYRPVTHVQKRMYSGDLYRIHTSGDPTSVLEVTAEHPFLSVKRKHRNDRNKVWEAEWRTPGELQKLDYLVVPVNRVIEKLDERVFLIERCGKNWRSRIVVPLRLSMSRTLFRLIGYYLAEGSVVNNSYLHLSFGVHEVKLIRDAKRCLRSVFNVRKICEIPHIKNHGLTLVVGSVEIARFFKQFGTSANQKSIPRWVLLEDPMKQRELIKGLYRGDGSYYGRRTGEKQVLKEVFRISTVSEILARQTRDLLLRMRVVSFINRTSRKRPRQPLYTVGVTGGYLHAFGTLVGIPVKSRVRTIQGLKRRASMYFVDHQYAYVPIRRIEKRHVSSVPVHNFGVEHDESYVAQSVAAHNCSAPKYGSQALHAGLVEIFVKPYAKARYSSVENWSRDTYNLNTKRAIVERGATMEWVGGNMGSGTTMLYPCSVLIGEGARCDHLAIAFANEGQWQDTGAKVIHAAPRTSSTVVSKSISSRGGVAVYRGLLKVAPHARDCTASIECDALLLDEVSRTETIPDMQIRNNEVTIAHEATVGKLSDDDLYYLQSRGIPKEQARAMIVSGFIEPIVRKLPLEYAVEMNRLIELEMEGSVG